MNGGYKVVGEDCSGRVREKVISGPLCLSAWPEPIAWFVRRESQTVKLERPLIVELALMSC